MPMQAGIPVINTFACSSIASGTTAAAILIPPCPGPPGNPPFPYRATSLSAAGASWLKAPNMGVTHITSLQITASSTAHTVLIMRPLNWTYFPAGLAKNTTVIPDSVLTGIASDPGLYATKYAYATPGGVVPAGAADAAISSTNLAVCYQLTDGSWQYDTIASGTFGSTLTLTTGTPNNAGGAIPAGAPLFYFGAIAGTLKDPATGQASLGVVTKVSAVDVFQDVLTSQFNALHPGDPLLVYDGNGTAADSLFAIGYYGQW